MVNKNFKKNKFIVKKGFTIVELVIVIAVIAILSTVLIPTFSEIVTKAKKAKIYSEANTIYKNYLVEELKDGDIPEYVIIEVDEDICIMYLNGEQIQEVLTLSAVKGKVEVDEKFNLIQLENYENIYVSEKIPEEENNETKEVEFKIVDGVLKWRYRGETEWKPLLELDDVGCSMGS